MVVGEVDAREKRDEKVERREWDRQPSGEGTLQRQVSREKCPVLDGLRDVLIRNSLIREFVLCVQLHFKVISKVYHPIPGHVWGDQCLKSTAGLAQSRGRYCMR